MNDEKMPLVTDEELADLLSHEQTPHLRRFVSLDLAQCLAASERARREEDAAIDRMLDERMAKEAGIMPRKPGESTMTRLAAAYHWARADATNERQNVRVEARRRAEADERASNLRAKLEAAEADLAALRAPLDDTKEARAWEALKAIEAKIAPCDWGFDSTGMLIPESHWRDGTWTPEEFQFIATLRNLCPWLRVVIDRALVWRDNLSAALAQVDRLTLKAGKSEAELAVLRAPVDVEATMATITDALLDATGWQTSGPASRASLELIVGPYIERAAQLAREVEGLRSLVASLRKHRDALAERAEDEHDAAEDARAEIERLTKAHAEAIEQRDNLLAEGDRLRGELAGARANVSTVSAVHALLHNDAR